MAEQNDRPFAPTSPLAPAPGRARGGATQFQLVFRHADGDRTELRDKSNGEPHINGGLIFDGMIFEVKGVAWLATRQDLEGGQIRFVCMPVEPSATA